MSKQTSGDPSIQNGSLDLTYWVYVYRPLPPNFFIIVLTRDFVWIEMQTCHQLTKLPCTAA